MNFSRTTLAGIMGAIALAVANGSPVGSDLHNFALVLSALAVAILGWHAQDKNPPPPKAPLVMLAIGLGVALLFSSGCKVGGFGMQVASPAFGTLGVQLDGGVIGHGHLPTNAPAVTPTPTR